MNFNNDDDIIISYSFSIMKMSRNKSKFSLGWKNSTSIINLFPHICRIDTFFQQIITFEENSIVAFYGAKGALLKSSIFPPDWSLTNTPGTDRTQLSPREYY